MIFRNFKLALYSSLLLFMLLDIPHSHAEQSELKSLLITLNQHIIDLEKRVGVLEGKLQKTSKTTPKGKQEWRRLKKGMSMDTVKEILGAPKNIEAGYLTYWYYASSTFHSKVIFNNNNLVYGWDEPK